MLLFNIAIRILLLPLIAGLAYEVTVKWAGNHPDNPLVKVLLWPGLQMQRMTTAAAGRLAWSRSRSPR